MIIDLYEEHKKQFGYYPIRIGLLGLNESDVLNDISIALDSNKPYNEENLLSKEDLKAYKGGELII